MLTFLNIRFRILAILSHIALDQHLPFSHSPFSHSPSHTLPSHTLLLTPSLLTLSLLTLSLLTPSLLTLSLLTFRLFSDSGTKKKLAHKEKQDGTISIPNNETINIFSIASGHLYERFLRYVGFLFSLPSHTLQPPITLPSHIHSHALHPPTLPSRIMMLSVLKHTQNPVKFWFLKNFLSPYFKVNACHMINTSYNIHILIPRISFQRWHRNMDFSMN